MKAIRYKFTGKIWIYPGESSNWHFLTVPKKDSADITERYGAQKRGWGSLPVHVTVGKSSWDTSIFPDKKSGTYLLPLKALIRRQEGLEAGDSVVATVIVST